MLRPRPQQLLLRVEEQHQEKARYLAAEAPWCPRLVTCAPPARSMPGCCSSLQSLSAEGNRIRVLPLALARLGRLQVLRLDDNRWGHRGSGVGQGVEAGGRAPQ